MRYVLLALALTGLVSCGEDETLVVPLLSMRSVRT
jgi:hypothetical protein